MPMAVITHPIIMAKPPACPPISDMRLNAPPPIIDPITRPINDDRLNLFSPCSLIFISPLEVGIYRLTFPSNCYHCAETNSVFSFIHILSLSQYARVGVVERCER